MTGVNVPDHLLAEPLLFGGGVRIERIPEWVRTSKALETESWSTKHRIEKSNAVFCVDYMATALGSPDPEWKGEHSRSIQAAVDEKIALAQLSIWLVVSCGWSAGPILHFGEKGYSDSLRRSGALEKILVNAREQHNVPTFEQLSDAAALHTSLLQLKRGGNLWVAIRMLALAASERLWDVRYILLWVMLEALFGPADGREIRFRIAQRIAQFLGESRDQKKSIFATTKKLYDVRSKAVHGARLSTLDEESSVIRMNETEEISKLALRKILRATEAAAVFDGKCREALLDELSFT